MMRRFLALIGGLVLVMAAVALVFVRGMRTKSPRVLDTVRRMNKEVFNPEQMKTAGTPGAYASVVHHTGRRSGIAYETPIVAVPTADGFVVALPYGSRADWVRNVLAAGKATLAHEGERHDVHRPEIVPIESVADQFTAQDHRTQRIFGVDQALQVRRLPG